MDMDFNTGSPGSGGQQPPPPPNRPSASAGGASGEFNLSDPVGTFISTARGVILSPVGFFRGMQKSGNYVGPLVFTVICAVIGGLLTGIISFLSGLLIGDFGTAIGGLIGGIFLTPIFAVIGLFIVAGILHLLVMLLVKPNAGFEATYRVTAYLSVLYLVSWLGAIPILGILVSLALTVYGIVLGVIGVRETHSTTTGRAAAVVLIPAVVFFLLGVLLFAAVLAAVFFGAQQGV
jgi:hypothetical protein